jgi:hypothetical protein
MYHAASHRPWLIFSCTWLVLQVATVADVVVAAMAAAATTAVAAMVVGNHTACLSFDWQWRFLIGSCFDVRCAQLTRVTAQDQSVWGGVQFVSLLQNHKLGNNRLAP